jgi:formamidopyrimidine-DNA glycosylase
MPELPDVEIFKQYLDATSLRQRIETVQVFAPEILNGVTAKILKGTLEENTFNSSRRHGKYLFVNLHSGPYVVLHFGMTGSLAYFKDKYQEPSHTRLLISFSNGWHLAYDCRRKLGKATLTEDVESFFKEKKWGADALEINLESFKKPFPAPRHPLNLP